MANGTDRYRSAAIARVSELFWREWDPIGVNHNDFMNDEYDRYAETAYVMLMDEGRDLSTRRRNATVQLNWLRCASSGPGSHASNSAASFHWTYEWFFSRVPLQSRVTKLRRDHRHA